MFDKLYMLNGTLFIVTDTPSDYPERKWMISNGKSIKNVEPDLRLPSDKEIRIINSEQAKLLFGSGADRLDGMTVRDHHEHVSVQCNSLFTSG
jgi:hypothetical protein